jgi:hypothetical protein
LRSVGKYFLTFQKFRFFFLFCEKVGNSEKSLEALKIQNGQFEKEGFGIRPFAPSIVKADRNIDVKTKMSACCCTPIAQHRRSANQIRSAVKLALTRG